jgi:glutamate/tyrosine decarboxylase-like PLP-dependent enzyme
MRNLLEATAARAIRYLESLEDRPVAPAPDAVARLDLLDTPLQDEPLDPLDVLQQLDELGSPATTAMAGSRFFGFVIGGSLPAALAANWLVSTWDQNAALYAPTPSAARLEQVALRWLLDVLRLPAESAGAFVTGTSVAHVTALAAARHAVLAQAGWDVEADGLFGAPPVTVAVGDEAHPTLHKALGILGFGRNRIVQIPTDSQGRMRPDAIPDLTGPSIVCVQAGNVNSGAFDPVEEICMRVKPAGAWVHVDGAFGLWAAASPVYAHLAAGIDAADSWATDAHKWLNVPYDSGLAFVRDGKTLQAAMSLTAAYLPTVSEYRNPADYTPELSRRARGVEVWAALRSLGRAGLAELIERTCRHARGFAEGLEAAGFRVLNDIVLNQVVVSFGAPEVTSRIIAAIQAEGTCWCGTTVWKGETAMRISISSWATTEADVARSLEAIVRTAAGYR